MMWQSFNPNPQGRRVGDCAVRAIAAALGESWDEAFYELAAQAHAMADMPSSDAVWGAVLSRHGFKRWAVPNTCPNCYTAAEFAADHPRGTFVLGFGGHVATIKDGILLDAWNSLDLSPQFYWFRR